MNRGSHPQDPVKKALLKISQNSQKNKHLFQRLSFKKVSDLTGSIKIECDPVSI